MRRYLSLLALALAGCSRPAPAIDEAEATALRAVLESAGTSLDRVVVYDDLYDFNWRGAEEHAHAHGLPDAAEKARKARDDRRDAVAVEKGHVVALRVGGTKLAALGPVTKLEHLVALDLHDGQVTDTTGLDALKDLDHVGLAGNHLLSTSAVSGLPKLRSVYLADNPIEAFEGFHDVPELEVVNLSGTRINAMTGFAAVPKLRALSLERTRVSHIEGLEGAPLLEDLNLSRCPIERIDDLGPATHLKFLNLWHSDVRFVAGLEHASRTLIWVGLGESKYDWGDAENIRVMNKVSPGRIITVL